MADPRPSDLSAVYDRLYANEQVAADEALPPLPAIRVAGWPEDRRQALVHLARPGGRLLEIGCGVGEVLATLAPNYDAAVGIELSPIRAERARRNLAIHANVTILTTSLEELAQLEPGSFDCIIWADVIEHVADVIAAMHTLAALARVGTQLVTVTPNVAFLPQRLRLLLGKAPNTALPWYPNEGFGNPPESTILLDAGHLHYFTFAQVETLYRIAGFRPSRRLGVGSRFGRLRDLWPTLLSGLVCVGGEYAGSPAKPV